MGTLMSVGTFAAGVAASAFIEQMVERVLSSPRVDCAIADLSVSRSRIRAHNAIPVTDRLRKLLAEGGTEQLNWDDRFISAHAVDYSVLELIEREETARRDIAEIDRLLGLLPTSPPRDFVLSVAQNQHLLGLLANALVCYHDRSPTVPAQDQQPTAVFPLVEKKKQKDGEDLVFIHLDLPGNPFPVVGSRAGRPELNAKIVSLGYSLSVCDSAMLAKILQLGREYAVHRIDHATTLRSELDAIQRQAAYLQVELVVVNRGKTSAYLSTSTQLKIGCQAPVPLSLVEYDEMAEQQTHTTVLRDTARRIADWAPNVGPLVDTYQSVVRYVTLDATECKRLLFASDGTIDMPLRNAIDAIRTGNARCTITLSQYTPRRRAWLGWINRFHRQITTVQSLRRG